MFKIGQQVVCVDASLCEDRAHLHSAPLIEDAVYTIRGVYDGGIGVTLEEIVSELHSSGDEYGYYARRFRPLVTKSTDTGFAILEEIRNRESIPADRQPALSTRQREGQS